MSNSTFSSRGSTRKLESGDSKGSGEMAAGRRRSSRSNSNSTRTFQMSVSRGSATGLSIILTNKTLDDGTTSCYGATALHLKSCTKPIEVRRTLSFSGTLVRLELDELILPHNLMVLLLTGCFLQEITFRFVCLTQPFPPRDGKIISPSVKSVTIIGDSSASALTKHEAKAVSFLANWVIFRKLRSISIYGQSSNMPGRERCRSICAIKDSSGLRKGRDALSRFCLDNAETLNEMTAKLPSDKSVEEAFEGMNRGVDSVHELRNRLFEFIKFSPVEADDVEKLAKLQFSVLKVLTSSFIVGKDKVLWDVLGNQKVLSTFVYLEQAADGKDHLEDVLGVVKACAGTLEQLSIVVGDVRKRVKEPAEFSMKPLAECKILRKLTLMMNKTKRIMNADLLPKKVESLKIMGVMGPNEIGNLFNGIQATSSTNLVSLQFFNILLGRDGSHVSKAERLYYQQGNVITAEMVLQLFQRSQLKKVLLCDRRLPTVKIKAAFCHLYGVSVKEFQGPHGSGITIYARMSDTFSEFSFLHDNS